MKYFTLTKLKVPACSGWYQTQKFNRNGQLYDYETTYRYWDGSLWSVSVGRDHTTEAAERLSLIKIDHEDNLKVGYIEPERTDMREIAIVKFDTRTVGYDDRETYAASITNWSKVTDDEYNLLNKFLQSHHDYALIERVDNPTTLPTILEEVMVLAKKDEERLERERQKREAKKKAQQEKSRKAQAAAAEKKREEERKEYERLRALYGETK